ncbi:hypothetical protein PS2_030384 [Malus domestica]
MAGDADWRKTEETTKMSPNEVKRNRLEGAQRPPGHNPGGVLHQRRGLPFGPITMAVTGFLTVGTIGYFISLQLKQQEKPNNLEIMLLKASVAFSYLLARGDGFDPLFPFAPYLSYSFSPVNSSTSVSSILRFPLVKNESGVVVCASKSATNRPLTYVVFEPFEEVKNKLDLVPTLPQFSLARQKYTDKREAVINEQINGSICTFQNLLYAIS